MELNNLSKFKEQGKFYLTTLGETEIMNMITFCNEQYYNQSGSILGDTLYDILKAYGEEKYPSNVKITSIGCNLKGKNKVKLPYYMASMNKIKPNTRALETWQNKYKGPYIITCKLDGISALYSGNTNKLYTRGDGIEGQDISHLIPYLGLNKAIDCTIRGELIMKRATFEGKYKDTYANARNMVSGLVNTKAINSKSKEANKNNKTIEMLSDIDFVVYEMVDPNERPSVQHNMLNKMIHLKKVYNTKRATINNELLSQILQNVRANYEYETDGIIVANDEKYIRSNELKNPEHAFAFKMILTEQTAETVVVDVLWSPSKDGYMKPRVQIEPVYLCGVKIEYATGFNAGYIYENKIGVGTIVEIIRSGDVIPHINRIIQSALEPKMPLPEEKYVWTSTKVDLIMAPEYRDEDMIILEKRITGFFKKLKVEGMGSGIVRKILNHNISTNNSDKNNIEDLIKATKEDFMQVKGIQETLSTKIYEGIKEKLESESLATLMAATNLFGRGLSEKRLTDIMMRCPSILHIGLNQSLHQKAKEEQSKIWILTNQGNVSMNTARQFIEGIYEFNQFMKSINMESKLTYYETKDPSQLQNQNSIQIKSNAKILNNHFTITGFRDSNLEKYILQNGGKVDATMTKKTSLLIIKDDMQEETTKIKNARTRNISIMTKDEFINNYNINYN